MQITIDKTRIEILQGDITKQDTQAIVNAANSSLLGGGGVDGAIHRTGGPEILEHCKKIRKEYGTLPPGNAVITPAGNLTAEFVIHTVGPIWREGKNHEAEVLKNCYKNSLSLAQREMIRSLSFPSISTGAYGYPIDKASKIAISTVIEYVKKHSFFDEIRFVLFSQYDLAVYEETMNNLI
ncbi:MAG TPA: O-acetyl-ADP-ribose deacetylase [Candidatus Cloacimonetes bacterium]|nr:O-acetyl-ADP-ribose deacetylase [Candidatus Cloacimonadota bacterium]HEX37821.1 O-acetyl-ADP-ribose deacetylase [Candidatus Cloacimonadota bacterium]